MVLSKNALGVTLASVFWCLLGSSFDTLKINVTWLRLKDLESDNLSSFFLLPPLTMCSQHKVATDSHPVKITVASQ